MSNWFKKLGLGLQKSSAKISNGLSSIFSGKKLSSANLDELEELLISTDMGLKAAAEIIKKFSARKFDKEDETAEIKQALAEDIAEILLPCETTLELNNKPEIILMVGVNGAGKTTTIGKLAAKFSNLPTNQRFVSETIFNEKDEAFSTERKTGVYNKVHEDLSTGETPQISIKNRLCQISLVAADTFRAAAVEQLKIWGERNKIRVHSGEQGCDAAGLCFEGIAEAIKQKDDLVFIDTAGRLQNKTGLMDELKKIIRVIKKVIPEAPQHIWLCLDATTGQNALDQVKIFKEIVAINGLIVNKLDGSAKGGILVAIAAETKLPILFVGVGEGIDDLDIFNAKDFGRNLVGVE